METARRFLIHGIVQGVGYRYFAIRVARRMGLRGYVRNLPTGVVEVVVEGNEKKVEEFKRLLEEGPAGAIVRRVEEEELSPSGRFTDFQVSY